MIPANFNDTHDTHDTHEVCEEMANCIVEFWTQQLKKKCICKMWPSYRKAVMLQEKKSLTERLIDIIAAEKELNNFEPNSMNKTEAWKQKYKELGALPLLYETYDQFYDTMDLEAIIDYENYTIKPRDELLKSWFVMYNHRLEQTNKKREAIEKLDAKSEEMDKLKKSIEAGVKVKSLHYSQNTSPIDMKSKLTTERYLGMFVGTPIERYTLLLPKKSLFYHGVRGKSLMYDDLGEAKVADFDELIKDGYYRTEDLVADTKKWISELKENQSQIQYYKKWFTRMLGNDSIRKLFVSNSIDANTYSNLGVIAFQCTRDLKLIDLSSPEVVSFFASTAPDDKFSTAFYLTKHLDNDNLVVVRRKSTFENDGVVVDWLCEQLYQHNIDGYYFKGTDLHEEIMICDPLRTTMFYEFHPSRKFAKHFEGTPGTAS